MLRRETDTGDLVTRGFLVAIEAEVGVSPLALEQKIKDGVWHMEGVGKVDVESLGLIDCYEDPNEDS